MERMFLEIIAQWLLMVPTLAEVRQLWRQMDPMLVGAKQLWHQMAPMLAAVSQQCVLTEHTLVEVVV
ncbi:MAG: hypothetical protein A2Z65_11415 [Gallionellales bacterium RIFCSPLOWO2_02_58_13]|nr:MAG: hypothetical protein A2Z65_11415 [Gallionellales bacterium RIFCSPLOWO2_02_58_13]